MVDSIKGVGVSPNILTGKTQIESVRKDEQKTSQNKIEDKVEISVQALNQQQAEKTAQETGTQLGQNPDVTLGLGPDFISGNAG